MIKDLLFNIFSLVDQLYQSKSTIPKSSKPNKRYFLENFILNLLLNRLKILFALINTFNKFIKDNRPINIKVNKDKDRIIFRLKTYLIKLFNIDSNKIVNKLFLLI